MINIVIPMAGRGSRFEAAGFQKPKPFIDINGSPMIMHVMHNLSYRAAKFTLIAQRQHVAENGAAVQLINESFNPKWVLVDSITEGTAATLLFARSAVENNLPLLIANSDQVVDGGISELVEDAGRRVLDGSIMTFQCKEKDPKWSYAKLNDSGAVTEVQEKNPISTNATVGIYYFKRADYYFESAIDMIIKNIRTNGEFYTCPTYNELIEKRHNIGIFEINRNQMHGIGTPDDLNSYLEHTNAK
jgi:UDP-N-acetylglucosamine diphosphorylase / glucose-1-phosphate thymidylyltransferase / UDP-N-acetylgalactosamine diphosphorylase / glucosamine-1-phosphate N-acetyltransferase / galactosamine-1-phosphate N-acetyltransferase